MAKKKKKPNLNEKQSRAESYNRFVSGINAMIYGSISCEVETVCSKCDDPEYSGIVQNPINVGVFICAKSVSFVVN